MALLQVETTTKTAELYHNEEGWQIAYRPEHPIAWGVVGPGVTATFETLAQLLATPEIAGRELPELVKWAARGLAGIPL